MNFKAGHPGFNSLDAWSWHVSGNPAYHGLLPSNSYQNHTLGNTDGKVVAMDYYGGAKRLNISCEGKVWTHTDQNFTAEAFFVFGLGNQNSKVTIVHN